MLTAILTVILFMVLIIPHEFGHFITAKLCGVQVNEFSVGMGPSLFHKQKGETLYSVRLLPLGGYCAMEGENEESENPKAFTNKSGWQKLLVLVAGAAMNILVANLVMIITFTAIGEPVNRLDSVVSGGPAEKGGILAGDTIVQVGEVPVSTWSETVGEISKAAAGEELAITVERDGQKVECMVIPETNENDQVVVGIQASLSHNIFRCGASGIRETWNMARMELMGFKMLVTGKAGADDIAGPVGIVQLVDQTRQYGVFSFMYLVALISLNLAILNLLPLPSLDGGRILFVIIRKITGNMISDEMEAKVHLIGIVLLIALAVMVTWNDIGRLLGR